MAQVGFALKINQAIPGDGKYSVDVAGVPGDGVATQAALLVTAKSVVGLANTAVGTVDTDVDLSVTAAALADTDVGLTVTALATSFTAIDVFGNALVAITGDSYSNTTHNWTTGGSTGLTHAQVATLMALFNTALTDFVTAQTANTLAKTKTVLASTAATTTQTASDLAVTAAALAVTDTNLLSFSGVTAVASGDAILLFDTAKFTKINQVRAAVLNLKYQAENSPSFKA